MLIPDLAPHPVVTGLKAIGYLSGNFPKGKTPDGFLEKLKEAELAGEEILTFGFHLCEYCRNATSSSDHILGEYIWPDMLAHYIKDHGYLPPSEFIDFIMSFKPDEQPSNDEDGDNQNLDLPEFEF